MTEKFNKTYRRNMLKIMDNVDEVGFGFRASAPTKIAGTKHYAFSLPAGPDFTCPKATEACKDCYASKGRHIFSSVQTAFMRNWVTFSFFERNNDIAGIADALLVIIKNAPIFRIHESGDFANQFAVDAWAEVARRKPETKFWFYTRSFHLDFSKLVSLPNVSAFASSDAYNKKEAKAFAKKFKIKLAFGPWDSKAEKPENSFVCPATNGKIKLDAACMNCRLCVDKKKTTKNVVFLAH